MKLTCAYLQYIPFGLNRQCIFSKIFKQAGKWLLLRNRSICCEIFKQVGERVAGTLEGRSGKRYAGSGLRIDARCMVDEVGIIAALNDLFGREIAGQLIDDGTNHFHMSKFFCT